MQYMLNPLFRSFCRNHDEKHAIRARNKANWSATAEVAVFVTTSDRLFGHPRDNLKDKATAMLRHSRAILKTYFQVCRDIQRSS